jgi:diguanylate cyclase (GGDEF)-like protein
MNPELLEKVLTCRDLPTLPAVAMRVVELTGSERVSFKELAEVIQNDQALAAKILRTVNSSMYAVRTRCSSVNQAIVMLGMSAVKTLALSFTLVSAIKECDTGSLDMEDHWRRALHTGIAARVIAHKARLPNAEECFLGGLLQDLGMVALHQTLGRPYQLAIAHAQRDHREVLRHEMKHYDLHHADIGALLAKRWKLPDTLVMSIKYHERPTAAPMEFTGVVRAVGLGNIASDVLASVEPAEPLRRFYERAEQWFGLDESQADDVLRQVGLQLGEAASLLSLPAGQAVDGDEIVTRARKQMEGVRVHSGEHGSRNNPSSDTQAVDELTGVASRLQFDRSMVAAFEQTRSGLGPLSVALLDLDGLEGIGERQGPEALDAILIEAAGRVERAFPDTNGLVARYDEGRFVALMPRTDRTTAVRLSERARADFAGEPFRPLTSRAGAPATVAVTVSVGVATVDEQSIRRFEDHEALMAIVEQAARAARKAGQNAIRVYAPTAVAA